MGARSGVWYPAVVLAGAEVPPRSLVAGVPAKVRRELTDAEIQGIADNGAGYVALAARHAAGDFPPAATG